MRARGGFTPFEPRARFKGAGLFVAGENSVSRVAARCEVWQDESMDTDDIEYWDQTTDTPLNDQELVARHHAEDTVLDFSQWLGSELISGRILAVRPEDRLTFSPE